MSRAVSPSRLAAHRVLSDVRAGAYADRSAQRRLAGLSGRDRAFALELAYGAIRLRGRLDAELAIRVDRPLARLDPSLLDWLRLGLYQVREMRVPGHAAVSETVAGARAALGRGPAGLANAVLRRAASEDVPGGAFPDPEHDPAGWLASWGSHPAWLVRRWLARWPLADVRRLVENDNLAPPVTFRLLDPVDLDAAPEGSRFRLQAEPGWPRIGRLVDGAPAEVVRSLRAVAQDPAASAVVDFVGADIEAPVLDACAAPGGKAVGLAELVPHARPFVAADASPRRLRRVVTGVRRAGSSAAAIAMDARRPAIRSARTILVDAPCSGTGVLRRRPDARWRLSQRRLRSLVALQAGILDACAEVLEPGGLLVYATCSLEPEENEQQVDAFLTRHPGYERDDRNDGFPGRRDLVTARGDLEVLPFRTGTDGAYAARLRRKGDG